MGRTSVTLPGTFGDVTPAISSAGGSGEWFAITSGHGGTQCFRGSGSQVSPNLWTCPMPLHFVRCAAGEGCIVAAGQRADGSLEVIINGQTSPQLSGGLAFGQNPVDVQWVRGDEFVLAVMRSPVELEHVAFDATRPDQATRHLQDVRPLIRQDGTSQGVLEIEDGSGNVVFTDMRRAVRLPDTRTGFVPNTAGTWLAAQGENDRLLVSDGRVVESVFVGATYEPRLVRLQNGSYVAACRAASAVVVVPDLRTLTPDTLVPETPTGSGESSGSDEGPLEPELTPMPDTSRVRPILEATWHALGRPDLGASSTREQRNAFFLSFCAVMHHGHETLNPRGGDARWGAKRADSGRPQSDDVLAWRTGQDDPSKDEFVASLVGWDLIPGAGAEGWRFSDPGHGEEMNGQMWIRPPKSALPAGGPSPGESAEEVPNAPELRRAADDVDGRYGHLRTGSVEQQREWIARVAFLLNRRLSTDRFGRKQADANRPISHNILARRAEGGSFLAISLMNEQTGARELVRIGPIGPPQLWLAPPVFEDMHDLVPSGPTDEAEGPASSSDPVEAAIARAVGPLRQEIDALRARVNELSRSVAELASRAQT